MSVQTQLSDEVLPVGEVATAQRFDIAALDRYLARHIEGYREGALHVRQFQGGASNPTFLLSAGNARYVMRKKPPGVLLASAHQVDREYRVMHALAATPVPVPTMRVLCEDDSIIGTAFYIMDFVPGRIFMDSGLPDLSPADRAEVYASFGKTLATLHNVDYAGIDLGDFGKPGDYMDRQLGRFTKQYRAAADQPLAEMEELIRVLPERLPPERRVTIVHGDFKLGNTIFHPTEPRLLAVLDWELTTIGDPLADLAFSALPWHRGIAGRGALDHVGEGIPSEIDYLRAYLRRTGRTHIDGWNFYLAFALFRLASIMQGVYRRVLAGTVASHFEPVNMAPQLAQQALALLEDNSLATIY